MALGYSVPIRNGRLNVVRDALDAGGGQAQLKIISGTRPATGQTFAGTILADLAFSRPSAANATNAVLGFNPIAPDSAANATNTATWARCLDSLSTFCIDGSVGVASADFIFPSVNFQQGTEVSVPTAAITAGNA